MEQLTFLDNQTLDTKQSTKPKKAAITNTQAPPSLRDAAPNAQTIVDQAAYPADACGKEGREYIPHSQHTHPSPSSNLPNLRLVSWNVNSINVRTQHVLDYLAADKPDVLMLQEIKTINEKFPQILKDHPEYTVFIHGQKAYNGVAVFVKKTIKAERVRTSFPCFDDDPQARILEIFLVDYGLYVLDIYLPNGNPYPSEKYEYKMRWMKSLDRWIHYYMEHEYSFVIGGDFNIIPETIDVYDPKSFKDDAAFHDDVRSYYRQWQNMGLVDQYRRFHPHVIAYSFWDYQKGRWMKNEGMRIDHFLTSPDITSHAEKCVINPKPRAWEKPSDHTPIELTLNYSKSQSISL